MTNAKMISVAGAGRMGRGIAVAFAVHGYTIQLLDIKERSADEFEQLVSSAMAEMHSQMEVLVKSNLLPGDRIDSIMNQITISHINDEEKDWANAKILFEAVPEVLDIKEAVYKQVCAHIDCDTLILSTTSSFSVDNLAEFVTNKERFLNTHWLNPAYLLPLVEVSPGEHTSEENVSKTFDLLESIGKVPVKCAPSPGFIVPRIQALAMNEAARMVEEGIASPEDIDKAILAGFGPRFVTLGLLEFIDWGGADTLYYASNYMKDSMKEERFGPPEIIKQKMENGHIGMKTLKGFYDFDEATLSDYQMETLTKLIDLLRHLGYLSPIQTESTKS